jgi:uncharacterized protein YbjT (DUF2867 family)
MPDPLYVVTGGSLEDAAFLTRAFAGATAVFAMVPPNDATPDYRAFQRRVVDALGRAVEAAKVSHVVTLSSIGGQHPSGNGPIAGLHELERRMDRVRGLNVLHLRPGYFMENLLLGLPLIRGQGIHGSPVRGDLPIQMIATRDVAAVAARRLAALDFRGSSVLELMGPRDVTMSEATAALGKALGKPGLPYVQFPYEAARGAMVGGGMPPGLADLYVEMARGINDGHVRATQPRTPATTTPTTVDAFAASAVGRGV